MLDGASPREGAREGGELCEQVATRRLLTLLTLPKRPICALQNGGSQHDVFAYTYKVDSTKLGFLAAAVRVTQQHVCGQRSRGVAAMANLQAKIQRIARYDADLAKHGPLSHPVKLEQESKEGQVPRGEDTPTRALGKRVS